MFSRKFSLLMALMIGFLIFTVSCDSFSGGEGKYKTTESGLKYKLIETNEDGKPVENDNVVSLRMTYGKQDSVIFNSDKVPDGLMVLVQRKSSYPGDFYEMMGLLHEGDSATFELDAESFLRKTTGSAKIPADLIGQTLNFNVKVVKVQTRAEYEAEAKAKQEQLKVEEREIIEAYMADNGLDAEPTESGLFVIETKKGNGEKPKAGEIVKVHYTGTLLDGTKFDSSLDRGQPFEFPIGQGRVIPGWDEGFSMLNEGTEATLLIPSYLAYGEQGAGASIPPNSILRFDITLVDVVSQEEQQTAEKAKIEAYRKNETSLRNRFIAENNITTKPTPSGLYVVITEEGTGRKPKAGERVKVHYTGTLLDGTKFDSSRDRGTPFEFPLGQGRVIKGWDEGIAMLNVGSKATLIIPSKLGYGERGSGQIIHPYATLVFDVELVGIAE
jgi:FKBP-type peptidyl-prolyl cis-trans isomerase